MSRFQGMDPASTAINTAANAADACRQIWELCELWHDAPKDIAQLRDELAQANEFFSMVQLAVTKHTWIRTADWVGQLTYELEECLHKAETVVREVQTNLNRLLDVSLSYGIEISNKRRRAMWLRSHDDISRLRSHLKDAMFEICSVLAILDSSGLSGVDTSLPVMKLNAVQAKGRSPESNNVPVADIDHLSTHLKQQQQYGMEKMTVLRGNQESSRPPRPESASQALERYNPERHKSRWEEHKRLVSRDATLASSFSRSLCADGCICACHTVKDWGRWAVHFPFLGTLTLSYHGITRRRIPCSNPRCERLQTQAKVVRVDVQPSVWLVRATMSVLLSFGLPSPELVLRVHKVTELSDVHSYINQLLWAVHRAELNGIQHFLQSRLVRADDFYGDPAIGYTPLRLALDRKYGDVARLLYHSGGFHGTLEGNAASSLLLWLEQDPTAAEFLTENFPLTAVIDEADYNTLHKIVIGLRHLDLHAYLATPEGLALVNQPNAFGRTPLHVAALRGDAAAVEALLDAGAARDARGSYAKHALHYACKAGSIAVVKALLARGASLQVFDSLNRTPLFDLVGYGSNNNPDLVAYLLAQGVVQRPADWVNATLLALLNKQTAVVERLLPYWPPAHELPLYPAIHIGFPDGVRLLLAGGADYRTIDAFGEGILHWLAGSGLEMLRLFKGVDIRGVAVDRRDNKGKTAVDILEGRWDLTEEFRREFMELLDRLEEQVDEKDSLVDEGSEAAGGDDENESKDEDGYEEWSEDEFFDAMDSLKIPAEVPEESPCAAADAPSLNGSASSTEALSPSTREQQVRNRHANEAPTHDQEDEAGCEHETPDGSDSDSTSLSGPGQYTPFSGKESESGLTDQVSHYGIDSEPKYSRSERELALEADKVFTDEAELKFLGTSAVLRGQFR